MPRAASRTADFSARVPVRGPGDVRSLARAFNAMSARLEETDRQRRASLADITHELRTPLTVIQGQLEAVIDGVYPADAAHLAPILDQVRTLDGLIEDLRTLTLVDSGGLTLRREPVDMAVLVSGARRAAADGHCAAAWCSGPTCPSTCRSSTPTRSGSAACCPTC